MNFVQLHREASQTNNMKLCVADKEREKHESNKIRIDQ